MAIEKQIVLRYRSEGHVRFQLPETLCEPEWARGLVAGLCSMEGIYRVDLNAVQGKLSIRFLATVCDFAAVIRRLHDSVVQLGQQLAPSLSRPRDATPAGPKPFWTRSVQGRIREFRETLLALRILGKRVLAGINEGRQRRPRWLTEMMNDLLMLRAGPVKSDSRLSDVSVLITAPARGENLRTDDETNEKKSLGRLQSQGGPGGAEG